MCKLDVLKFYGYVVGDQIYQTPSPQHNAPLALPPTTAAAAAAAAGAAPSASEEVVPVIVVGLPQHNISSLNPSAINYHQRSPSSSYHQQQSLLQQQQQSQQQQPQQGGSAERERGRRNSAPATMPQIICTASRQVTDV